MNIEATVVESLPGGIYKVKLETGEDVIEKCLFKGEMVPLSNEGATLDEANEEVTIFRDFYSFQPYH